MTGLAFLKTALRDRRIGAITRSSSWTVDAVVRAIPARARCVIEYGPGDGVTTQRIFERLASDGTLIGIERNATFAVELRRIRDPRFTVVHGDVLRMAGRLRALARSPIDAVVSGIPCTLFTPEQREALVRHAHAAIVPGGRFVIYQYSPLMLPMLRRYFRRVDTEFVPLNFLPYFVMAAVK